MAEERDDLDLPGGKSPEPTATEPANPSTVPTRKDAATQPDSGGPVPAVAAQTTPKHSAYSKRKALRFGLTEQQIEGASPEALEAYLDGVDEQLLAHARQQQKQPEPPKEEPEEDINLGIDEDQFIDEWKPFIKNVKEHLKNAKKETKELKKELSAAKEREQKREQAELDRQQREQIKYIDGLFEKLGAKGEKMFGAGSVLSMKENDPSFLRRKMLVQSAQAQGGDFDTAFKQLSAAMLSVVPDEPDQKVEKEKSDWLGAGLDKPTQRKSPDMPYGPKRAIFNLEKNANTAANGIVMLNDYAGDDDGSDLPK